MSTMITWLNVAGPIFCRHAFWMLIQTGVLFGILWCLDRLLRRFVRASFRYCLWLLILIKLLLPVDFCLPSGLGYWFRLPDDTQKIVSEYTPQFQGARSEESTFLIPSTPQVEPENPTTDNLTVPSAALQPVSMPATVRLSKSGLLFAFWLVGAGCLIATLVYQIISVRRLLLRSGDVPKAVDKIFSQCCKQVGIAQSVRLRQSDETPIPAVCGLWHPTVLLPTSLINQLDTEKLQAVLMHELGHIQRKDLWVNMIQMILQLFYFYNPFVRLANHWIRKTREQANDEHVLVRLQGRREIYSNTLIDVAAGAVARPSLAIRMIGVAEPKTQLHERITLMMQKPVPKNVKTNVVDIAVLMLCGLLLLPMAAGPKAFAEKTAMSVPTLTQQQALDQEKQLVINMIESFNQRDLDRFLSAYSENNISLHDQAAMTTNKTGLRAFYASEFSRPSEVLDHDYTYHEVWLCGEYMISATQDKLAFQVESMPQMLTLLRNYLTVYQIQPDGTLKINVQGENMADPKDIVNLPDAPAAPVYHTVASKPIMAGKLNSTLENVKQLDIEFHQCFNRQDQKAAIAYYADKAVLLPIGKNPTRGPEAIEAWLAEVSNDLEHINNNHQIIHAEGNDQMVIIVNLFNWEFKVTQTGERASMPGKGIHVWQKQPDGSWKILLDIYNTNAAIH